MLGREITGTMLNGGKLGLGEGRGPMGRVGGRERHLISVLAERGPHEVSGKMTWKVKAQLRLSHLRHSCLLFCL